MEWTLWILNWLLQFCWEVKLLLLLILHRHFSIHGTCSHKEKEYMISSELSAAVMWMGSVSFIGVSVYALQLFTCISL